MINEVLEMKKIQEIRNLKSIIDELNKLSADEIIKRISTFCKENFPDYLSIDRSEDETTITLNLKNKEIPNILKEIYYQLAD